MSVLVVGQNSFLAQSLKTNPACKKWKFIGGREAMHSIDLIKEADVVINAAFASELLHSDYSPDLDIDSKLAQNMTAGSHYIMLSSRMVYGQPEEKEPFSEETACAPQTPYGKNKLRIEQSLQSVIPNGDLTILRLSNIFGYELGRNTFFGIMLKGLLERKEITFDIAPDSVRDFLPVQTFGDLLPQITEKKKGGIYNIGSGVPIECQEISEWLIQGYGAGTSTFTGNSYHGEFRMNINKAVAELGLKPPARSDIRAACMNCGDRLRSSERAGSENLPIY